jgi:hypothetical protein
MNVNQVGSQKHDSLFKEDGKKCLSHSDSMGKAWWLSI